MISRNSLVLSLFNYLLPRLRHRLYLSRMGWVLILSFPLPMLMQWLTVFWLNSVATEHPHSSTIETNKNFEKEIGTFIKLNSNNYKFPFGNNKAFTSSIRTAIGYKESSLVESADIFISKHTWRLCRKHSNQNSWTIQQLWLWF